jgi:hypothetical protein
MENIVIENGCEVLDNFSERRLRSLSVSHPKGSPHINELTSDYPWRELFTLMNKSGYDRYTLCEAAESKEPERFLRYYKSLWTEFSRA